MNQILPCRMTPRGAMPQPDAVVDPGLLHLLSVAVDLLTADYQYTCTSSTVPTFPHVELQSGSGKRLLGM